METKEAKTRNTFNVVCLIRKNRVMKNGQVPLFMRITVKGLTANIPVTGSVDASLWCDIRSRGNASAGVVRTLIH